MLKVHGLHKRFTTDRGEVRAVQGVSFETRAGEFVTLLGPSGCGKSTTLRCIAGLEVPDQGEIRIGSEVVFSSQTRTNVPVERRNIGLVFQSYAVWPHMTVYKNVAFPLRVMKPRPSRAELDRRVREALQLVHLEDLADRPVPQLSGGQQQRVALARALVRRPALLLLDEPLSNLDAKLRAEMREEIVDITRSTGVATIYVTHDQVEALAMSDRILVILDGKIVQDGTPAAVYTSPQSRFVAEFVGSSNLVDGVLVEANQTVGTARTSLGLLRCRLSGLLAPGDHVLVCIRPEDVEVLPQPRSDLPDLLPARVERVTYLGDHLVCWLRSGETLLNAQLGSRTLFGQGQEVFVHLPAEYSQAIARQEVAPREAVSV